VTAYLAPGTVRHRRLRPVPHRFAYPALFLLVPMRQLHATGCGPLAHNRRAPISFHDADHGDGRANALEWLLELLAREGVKDVGGEVWLHCAPRILGYAFKPVSFWYCHSADGDLRAVVAEVHNTFGERHCYLLDGASWGRELRARKVFHVSPFCRIEGGYRFRFAIADGRDRIVARIDYDDADGPLLETSIEGTLQPADARSLRAAFWCHPAASFGVVARIHWQALRLWLRGVRWYRKPEPPAHPASLGTEQDE
jgi:DUF1365 family protein